MNVQVQPPPPPSSRVLGEPQRHSDRPVPKPPPRTTTPQPTHPRQSRPACSECPPGRCLQPALHPGPAPLRAWCAWPGWPGRRRRRRQSSASARRLRSAAPAWGAARLRHDRRGGGAAERRGGVTGVEGRAASTEAAHFTQLSALAPHRHRSAGRAQGSGLTRLGRPCPRLLPPKGTGHRPAPGIHHGQHHCLRLLLRALAALVALPAFCLSAWHSRCASRRGPRARVSGTCRQRVAGKASR